MEVNLCSFYMPSGHGKVQFYLSACIYDNSFFIIYPLKTWGRVDHLVIQTCIVQAFS
jgi:hypothetical protein